MVKIIDFEARQNEQGEMFNVLIVQGGIMPVISKETGKTYLTSKKATVPSTFDSETCQELIGTRLEGKVVKVDCDPYAYTIEETGELIELSHRYEYVNEELLIEHEHLISDSQIA